MNCLGSNVARPVVQRKPPTIVSTPIALCLAFLIGIGHSLACTKPKSSASVPNPPTVASQPPSSPQRAGKDSGSTAKISPSKIQFHDRSETANLAHRYDDGRSSGVFSIVESLGGGLAIVDFDRDGHLDLAYCGGGGFDPPNRQVLGKNGAIYRGGFDFRFQDETTSSFFDIGRYYNHALIAGDYDGDGWMDLLVTGYGGLQLLRNLGDGTFLECAESSGLTDRSWSSCAAWGDVDADGDLDLYVAHYGNWSYDFHPPCIDRHGVRDVCGPRDFDGLDDTFYRNEGDGRFTDITKSVGLTTGGRGLGVLAADLDIDGDVEFYVANDEDANFLYRNDGGQLVDIGIRSGTALDDSATPNGSMGIGLGDYNGDGQYDLFVTHYETETCALYSKGLGLNYKHSSRRTNITSMGNLFVAWGTAFVDFDNDLDEDIVVVNGHAIRHSTMAPVDQVPVLLENRNRRSYQNIAAQSGEFFEQPRLARGLAVGDFDRDGRMDFASSTILQPNSIVQNVSENAGHSLIIRLIGVASPRDAIGAHLQCHLGSTTIHRQIFGGGSYASTSDYAVHFGLGTNQSVDELAIQWPSGRRQSYDRLPADQEIWIVEGHDEYLARPLTSTLLSASRPSGPRP